MSTTVIDALLVTLGLDVTGFKKGQKEADEAQDDLRKGTAKTADAIKKAEREIAQEKKKAAEEEKKRAKEAEERNKKVLEGLTSLKTGFLEVLAVLGVATGFKDFIFGTMNSQAALGRLSTNLKMNARDVKAWIILVEESGGKAEDAYGSLMTIQQGLGEAMANGHSDFTDTARSMGIGITNDMIRNQDEAGMLGAIASRLQSLPRPLAQYDANKLGIGGMFNALMDPNYQKNLEEAQKVTQVTDASARAAERLQKRWVLLQETFVGVKDKAWAAIEPALEKLVNWLDTVDWNALVKDINDVVQAFGGWKTILTTVAALLAIKFSLPLISVVGWLLRLAPAAAAGASGIASIGTAAGVALLALTALAAFHIDGLGGSQRADGTYQDEPSKAMTNKPSGVSRDELWKRILGKPSAYRGDQTQAATILAGMMYSDTMSEDTYRSVAADILSGKIRPSNAGLAAPSASFYTSSALPRGVRNNNPGNLNYAGQNGAQLEAPGGRFAAFGSMDQGIAALQSQLVRYVASGYDTITKIVNRYAPAGDHNNVSAYIADLVKQTGDKADQTLGANDIPALMRAIINHEGNGKYVTDADINSGLRYGARSRALAQGKASTSKSVTNDVHIGQLTVQTKATDARGIAADLPKQLQNQSLLASLDTGAE